MPRPETEELVEWAKDWMEGEGNGGKRWRVLDVGTGTGCIGISLAKECKGVKVEGVEICRLAKELTEENVEIFRVEFGEGSEYGGVWEGGIVDYQVKGYDLIVSNPPYIPRKDMEGLERNVKEWEDYGALEGGEDGLDVIREILEYAKGGGVKRGGRVFIEGDEGHPKMIETMVREWGWEGKVEKRTDLRGRERFVMVQVF